MGYSAGGHLALLYAYMAKRGYYNYGNQIELVISEAGPTNFVEWDNDGNLILPDNNACAMAGITENDNEDAKEVKLTNASPLTYVMSNSLYTILAYGNGVYPYEGINTYTGNVGDGIIPYSHAKVLQGVLGENNCPLFELTGVGHSEFGEGQKVYPNTTYDNEWGVNEIIDDYYDEISSKLQGLAQQED